MNPEDFLNKPMPDPATYEPVMAMLRRLGAKDTALVGSSYTIGKGNDIDVLALVPNMQFVNVALQEAGWVLEGMNDLNDLSYQVNGDEFNSLRKDGVNVLITGDLAFFNSFKMAAEVCKYLRLESRDDRVAVHKIVMHGYAADEV